MNRKARFTVRSHGGMSKIRPSLPPKWNCPARLVVYLPSEPQIWTWVKYKQLRESESCRLSIVTPSDFFCCGVESVSQLLQDSCVLKSTLSPLTFETTKQPVSKERAKFVKLSDDPEPQQQLEQWMTFVCYYKTVTARSRRVALSHHALSWLFKWQRWSICALAISMSKSICPPRLGGLEAHGSVSARRTTGSVNTKQLRDVVPLGAGSDASRQWFLESWILRMKDFAYRLIV